MSPSRFRAARHATDRSESGVPRPDRQAAVARAARSAGGAASAWACAGGLAAARLQSVEVEASRKQQRDDEQVEHDGLYPCARDKWIRKT